MSQRQIPLMFVCAMSLMLFFSAVINAQELNASDVLNRRTRATEIRGKSIPSLLSTISDLYDIPIGVELGDPIVTPERKIDLIVPETSLRLLLDTMISKDRRYVWKLESGVIHLLPTQRDPVIAAFLNTRISHFAFAEGTSKNKIMADILALPEIRAQMMSAGVKYTFFEEWPSPESSVKVSIDESNLTLAELLDKIVLGSNLKQWLVSRITTGHDEFIALQI